MRKILGYVAVVFVVWFIVTNPTGAAGTVHTILGGLQSIGGGFADFVAQVSS